MTRVWRCSWLAGTVALALLCPVPRAARAADVGEVVVLEDQTGAINAAGVITQDYLGRAACAFYAAGHGDAFDGLVFFTTIPQTFLTGTPAGWPVKAPAKGIGLDLWFDLSASFCSPRLRHAVRMGELAALPDSPDGLYSTYPWTGIEVLGHEMGHQWLAYVSFAKGDGLRHCMLRGFNSASSDGDMTCDGHKVSDYILHWSFYFNTGSLMYGNEIVDLGGGKFRLQYVKPRYSPLDQYLMGLRSKSDVPAQFLVDKGDPAGGDSSALPLVAGQTRETQGTRLDFTVEDIVRAEGERVPARESCHWKVAFAIVHAAGKPPTAAEIAKVDAYRKRWEEYYAWATDGRGSVDTTLHGGGQGTKGCPASGIQPDASVARDGGGEASRRDGTVSEGGGCGCHAGASRGTDEGEPEERTGASCAPDVAFLVVALLAIRTARARARRSSDE